MKEKQIPFRGEMVRAILEGRKSQTRRLNGLKKINLHPEMWHKVSVFLDGKARFYCSFTEADITVNLSYGVGDRLWVRETWCESYYGQPICYKADGGESPGPKGYWRHSMFMPRWASRINLEVTGVRVERVQDISRDDAIAEGIIPLGGLIDSEPWCASLNDQEPVKHPEVAFARLWNSINGKKHPWGDNPWVWVIEFKKAA